MTMWIKGCSASLLLFALAAGFPAQAATPWISVPSTPDAEQKVVISGGDLPAGSAVFVRIQHPNGLTTRQAEAVKADGSFTATYLPGMPGGYAVTVYDLDGQEVGKGSFGYIK